MYLLFIPTTSYRMSNLIGDMNANLRMHIDNSICNYHDMLHSTFNPHVYQQQEVDQLAELRQEQIHREHEETARKSALLEDAYKAKVKKTRDTHSTRMNVKHQGGRSAAKPPVSQKVVQNQTVAPPRRQKPAASK